MMTGADRTSSMLDAIENDAAQMDKRHRIIRREVGSSECKEEAADYSKSEAELVEVADTLKRAISERMRVISLPSHRRDTSFVVRETGHTKRA